MNFLIPIGEGITYILFSFLIGHVVLQLVPASKKPEMAVPKKYLLLSVVLIIGLTFLPVLKVILSFYQAAGISQTVQSVLMDFQIGQSWMLTAAAAIVLWLVLYLDGPKFIQGMLLLFMIFALGYASHAASLSFWAGMASHSIHFLAVALWAGVLLNAAWFTIHPENLQSFLKWFTPFAAVCFAVLTAAGLFVMNMMVDLRDYVQAWPLSYGQVILLKHLSIIPLLVFAFLNGFVRKKAGETVTFAWIRAESLIIGAVFFLTGFLGTQAPPHDVNVTLRSEGAAPLFEWVKGTIEPQGTLSLHFSIDGILLLFMAGLFLGMIVLSFMKKRNAYAAVVLALLFIVSAYLGLMSGVSVS
ncbi:CopD family protein [Metabacillus indicus]|uniref:copper resistance D family protein n=1 Tax=Metabacillus indicus TaxID=246786 RepID=UPI00316D0DE8